MGKVPHNKNIDDLCGNQNTFKRIAELLGVPEDLMQFYRFVYEIGKVVKAACLHSEDTEIQELLKKYNGKMLFPYNISDSDIGIADKIVTEIQQNRSLFYSSGNYGNWLRRTIYNGPELGDYRAIRVNKEKNFVLIQKFTPSDSIYRSVIHKRFYVNSDGNLVEDEFVEDSHGCISRYTVSSIDNRDIVEKITSYDHLGFTKSITTARNDEDGSSEKPRHPTSFTNSINQIFHDER